MFIFLRMFESQQQCLESETVKMGGTREKRTPNLLNFNVNSPNLVHKCAYNLPITEQNLAKKRLA